MAEAIILSPLLQVAFESLNSMIRDEVSLVWGVKQVLEDLSSTLSTIKSVLVDAEEKQVKDNSVRDWLKKLKDVAYQVDDILDDYAIEALRWKAEHPTETANTQVSNFLSCICFKKVVFRRSIGIQIRDVNERLRKITDERSKYHLREGVSEKKVENNRETHSFVDAKTVLGRESEKKKIIDLLVSSDDMEDNVFVIPIVGLGGLGKTTLAQFVYNDEEIKKHFQPRMWVCVSEDFDIKRLIKAIIESKEKSCQLGSSLDLLQDHLRKMLSGKRFLLVLDDVWNEDQGKWERLKHLLRGGEKGSRIIVTTRSEKVSVIMGTTSSTHLKGLSDDECWSLIKERAFEERIGEVVQRNLVEIGMEIVKKCKGVPLAAKTLGSLLRFKREESEWLQIRDSETWSYLLKENEDDNILNALRISYDHLPSHLKQCFTYCSIFPKDCVMEKDELIKLCMAQGFIEQPLEESSGREVEDIGSDYFNALLWRFFFQDAQRDYGGNIICKMHDLMHDLAQSIAKDECFIIQTGKNIIAHNKRPYHLTLLYEDDLQEQPTLPRGLYKCSYLRTLRLFHGFHFNNEVPDHELFLKLSCLRVLDLRYCRISKLPDSIGNLKHLRYLNLRNNPILRLLPETICDLWNLQTLDIRNCHRRLSRLPERMKNMISLRHLQMDHSINYMPSGIGRLICLQALRVYRVGKEESQFGGLGELQHLIKLRGELLILELENAKNIEEAKKANLRGKQHLHTLKLYWTDGRGKVNAQEEEEGIIGNNNAQEVLEALQPHTNLKDLSIRSYGGAKFPSWMGSSSFINMVSISLYDFASISCECLPSFGKLQLLKELRIEKVYGVKYFSTTDGSNEDEENTLGRFPSLEKVLVYEMPDLEYWSTSGEGNLSFLLLELDIKKCQKLRALPKLQSLKKLKLYEMPNLQDLSAGVEGNLSFLLELDINKCQKLRALPKLPSLKKLKLDDMPNLQDLSAGVEGNLSFLLELDINKCQKLRALPKLQSLGKLKLHEMPDLEDLSTGGEGNLSFLRELDINKCQKLRALPKLQSLKKLKLDKMPNLEDWSTGGEGNFRFLLELDVNNCQKLRALPKLQSLTKLKLYEMPNLEDWSASGGGNLSRLRQLDIKNCPKLRALPELPSLDKLILYEMPNLEDWSITGEGNLSCLRKLEITNCPKLRALPKLPSLDKLELYEMPNLEDWLASGERNLSQLRTLIIKNCSKLRALPDLTNLKNLTLNSRDDEILLTFEHLPSLDFLSIMDCDSITSLPDSLKNLSALKTLNISSCPKLGSLPEGLKHLHALECLDIYHCPLLRERCTKGGEDWPNIAHVAHIYYDDNM